MTGGIRKAILPVLIFFLTLFTSYSMARGVPESPAGGEVLDLSGGKQGYYYAEDTDDCFDNEFLKNGMTVELWFCPARCRAVRGYSKA